MDATAVLFVTLNLTDKTTIHQSVMLAQALNVGEFVKKQGAGTGYIVLLDATSKKEVARLDGNASQEDILNTIKSAVK